MDPSFDALTPAEIEVVRLVSAGLTNPQVAERLFVSRSTVHSHLKRIFKKLQVRTRTELAARAIASGALEAKET
jgi:DNA-binding CsgD family transcriptional regulator